MIERVSEVRSAGHGGTEQPGPAPAGPADDTPDPRRWRALSVTLTAGFMSLLDVSIVAVALPSMRESLGASPAAIQWVVSGYALTFGLALVPAGRLGDAVGRRRMFLAALAGFVRVQCRGRGGAERGHAGRGPPRAGHRRRGAGAAELGTDPAALPGRGTGTRVRVLRCHGRDLHRGGPGARRRHPRAGRGPRRMAVDLLRQRAHRARRPRARRTAASARRDRVGAGRSTSWGSRCSAAASWP